MLGLDYHHNAYAFWNKFEIDKVSSYSVPDKLYSFPNNGFASISLFLTGSEGYAFEIKEALNKYFFTNMKTLGNELGYEISSWDHQKVAATIFSKAMVDIHFLALIHLINCRIGIFDGKMWKYYGTWNHWGKNVLTFLVVFNNGMYCPVLSLKD
uniref:Uncharacterized protein n=1 Tax=Panagrolaimus superbus TaxID=310955 RepID=A0A914YST1_9BILA